MDSLFVIDTGGNTGKGKKSNLIYSVKADALDKVKESPKIEVIDDEASENVAVEVDEVEGEYIITNGLKSIDLKGFINKPALCDDLLIENEPEEDTLPNELADFYNDYGWIRTGNTLWTTPVKQITSNLQNLDSKDIHSSLSKTNVAKEMKTSINKGMEQKHDLKQQTYREGLRTRKAEASKTKGKDWFNMPATEMTEELRQDMEVIQMRSVLDPKHFYKKNDMKVLPKYFQVGTVLPSPLDRHNERGIRVSKKRSLVDELLEDAEFQQFNKRKYNEVMAEKSRNGFKKAYKKMKKLKKRS